jgi:protein-tyrosine phosphatase
MKTVPTLYWIDGPWPGRLAVSPRPRGGDWLEDEVAGWRTAGVDVVASLLTPEEVDDLGLTEEANFAAADSLRYLSLPIPDRDIPPSQSAAVEFARTLADELDAGRNVVVHCRQGIGRSGLVATAVLVTGGINAEDAVRRVAEARGLPIPETEAQQQWIERVSPVLAAPATPRSA